MWAYPLSSLRRLVILLPAPIFFKIQVDASLPALSSLRRLVILLPAPVFKKNIKWVRAYLH
jgi:hypothetical protein